MLDNFLALPLTFHVCIAGVFGLMVGSFLNVVIYRLPKIMHAEWTAQAYEWLNKKPYEDQEPFTLSKPASHCYGCNKEIKPWQNIPVISYLALGGECSNCQSPISIRYPLIELLSAALSAYVVYRFGATLQSLFGVLLTFALIALTFIDFDHQLLPDDIVLPFLWLGLGLSIFSIYTNPIDSIIGAIAGYLFFWFIYHAFRLVTGKEGMGYGDFKLMSLLGAWFGWQYLPQIILLSTFVGSLVGISLILSKKSSISNKIPFGPYIAIAGYISMLWGDYINNSYLSLL